MGCSVEGPADGGTREDRRGLCQDMMSNLLPCRPLDLDARPHANASDEPRGAHGRR